MKIRFYFCFLIFTSFGFSQEMTELDYLGLKGHVKSMDEIDYFIFKDSTVEERDKTSYLFNKKGIKSLVKYYKRFSKNGAFSSTKTEFDANDNPIKKVSYENDTLFLNKVTYEYNEKNKVIFENHYGKNDFVTETYEFVYDSMGNLNEKIVYGYGKYVLKNIYSYDEKNRKILTEVYNQKLEITSKYGIVYKNDLIIERNSWSINNPKYTKKTINTYDSKKHLTKSVEYENTFVLYEIDYEHDDRGNQLSYTVNYPNGTKTTTLKKFDHNNNMTEISELVNGELKSVYYTTFEYDANNNWIERTWSDEKNDKNRSRTKRIITYYD